MRFFVLTLFPEMIIDGLCHSMIKRAVDSGLIEIIPVDIRQFSKNKHRHVDDYPYGGGAGMIMQAQPVYDAYISIKDKAGDAPVIYMSPQGQPYNQSKAEELSKKKDIVLLCGHYEGIDQRAIDLIVTEEISMGDFVLTGGELAAMAVIDSVSRLVPGVLNKEESFMDESFSAGILEYPQYTRPEEFMGIKVPEVLLSGHHGNVDKWRREKALENTLKKCPELLKNTELSKEDIKILERLEKQ